jgi:hypothetical protein
MARSLDETTTRIALTLQDRPDCRGIVRFQGGPPNESARAERQCRGIRGCPAICDEAPGGNTLREETSQS